MASQFDQKYFNAEAFAYSVQNKLAAPKNALITCKAIGKNPDLKKALSEQSGSAYAHIAMRGILDADAYNYDGGGTSPSADERARANRGRATNIQKAPLAGRSRDITIRRRAERAE